MSATEPHCPICAAPLPEPTMHAPDRLHGTGGMHYVARCQVCGAGVTLPRVTDQELAAFYPDEYGPYSERMSMVERWVSRVIRAFQGWSSLRSSPLSALRDRPPGRGLDVGCGRGDLAATLVARGWAMTGVEPSSSACAAAAARGIDARCGTLGTVALEPESYDAVIFRHSLEHVNDPVDALRRREGRARPRAAWCSSRSRTSAPGRRGGSGASGSTSTCRGTGAISPRRRSSERSVRRSRGRFDLDLLEHRRDFPGSLQYRFFGRCLFPGGFGLRVASGLCALALPAALALDTAGGGGDQLHAVARRPG